LIHAGGEEGMGGTNIMDTFDLGSVWVCYLKITILKYAI